MVFDGAAPGGDRELGQMRLVGVVVGTADDRIVQEAAEALARGEEVWLATSDRELRERVGNVGRLLGGGSFARELVAARG